METRRWRRFSGTEGMAFAVWLGGALGAVLLPHCPLRDAESLAALLVVLGHMFPVWLGFHGGKGVSTGFGAFLVAAPPAALADIGVFALVLAGLDSRFSLFPHFCLLDDPR